MHDCDFKALVALSKSLWLLRWLSCRSSSGQGRCLQTDLGRSFGCHWVITQKSLGASVGLTQTCWHNSTRMVWEHDPRESCQLSPPQRPGKCRSSVWSLGRASSQKDPVVSIGIKIKILVFRRWFEEAKSMEKYGGLPPSRLNHGLKPATMGETFWIRRLTIRKGYTPHCHYSWESSEKWGFTHQSWEVQPQFPAGNSQLRAVHHSTRLLIRWGSLACPMDPASICNMCKHRLTNKVIFKGLWNWTEYVCTTYIHTYSSIRILCVSLCRCNINICDKSIPCWSKEPHHAPTGQLCFSPLDQRWQGSGAPLGKVLGTGRDGFGAWIIWIWGLQYDNIYINIYKHI